MEQLDPRAVQTAVRLALEEDLGSGDATSIATVPVDATASAVMVARESLVLAGITLAEAAFRQLSSAVRVERRAEDGSRLGPGQALLKVNGPARTLLSTERVALNFVQRLSGVATAAAAFVDAVKGTDARILDTRKTTPGWRRFEKYAVVCGGAQNHRMGLYDMVLIKDNHLVALRAEAPNPIAAAVARARASFPTLKVEVEADTLEQVDQVIAAGADMVLLDNMPPETLREAVQKCHGKIQTEASGGISLHTIRAVAETGVDFISVGAITHSARAVDIALDFQL